MRMADKLRARWFKTEDDLGGNYPLGSQTRSDLGWLLCRLEPLYEQLERRGYDKRTLRFSIEPKAGNQRFASQREGDGDD